MSRHLLAVAAVVALFPSNAFAGPSRAWNAAKGVHPEMPIIAGIDVASAKSSETFKKFYPMLIKQKPEVQDVLDKLKATCKFDPFTAINSAVAVVDDSNDNTGAFYIALTGWNAAKLGACAKKVAKGEKKNLGVGPVKKGIQELTMKGEAKKMYLGWIGKDVLVVATDPSDRTLLEKVLSGKGGGTTGAMAAKIDTGATVWMAVIKEQQIQQGITMKGLYGTVKIAKGNVDGDLHVVTGDEKQATSLVTAFNKEMPNIQKGLPPAAKSLATSLKMSNTGAEVQATATSPEKDLLGLLGLVLGGM
jgi:hypothetical protein